MHGNAVAYGFSLEKSVACVHRASRHTYQHAYAPTVASRGRRVEAVERNNRVEVAGEIPIGDTGSLLGLHTYVAVLHEPFKWSTRVFKSWMTTTSIPFG